MAIIQSLVGARAMLKPTPQSPMNASLSSNKGINRVKNELPKLSEFGVVWFPFLGQPHPINDYTFADTTNTNFVPSDFDPKYDPEDELYYFMLELYQYVQKAEGGPITRTQLSKTLNNALPADWILRSGALSAINRIMRTRYTLDMRARDYNRFKGSLDFYNNHSTYSAQLAEFTQKPGGKLEVWLLAVHPEVREQLMLKYAEHFNVGGHPIYDPVTQAEKYQWLVASLESSALDVHKAIRQKSGLRKSQLAQDPNDPLLVDEYDLFDKDSTAGAKLDTGDGEVLEGGDILRKFPTRPCQVMSIDYVPGFPEVNGKERLLIVQDRFTKGIFLEAVSSNDPPEIYWELFGNIVKRAGGFPEQLISSGRRTRFKGEFDRMCVEQNIKHLKTSAFRPQIGGGLQQAKKRCMSFLKDKTKNYHSTEVFWTSLLPECEVDYNSKLNPVSCISPYYCMYGSKFPPELEERMKRDKKTDKSAKTQPIEPLEMTWKRVFYRLKAHADSATASYQRRTSNILPPVSGSADSDGKEDETKSIDGSIDYTTDGGEGADGTESIDTKDKPTERALSNGTCSPEVPSSPKSPKTPLTPATPSTPLKKVSSTSISP